MAGRCFRRDEKGAGTDNPAAHGRIHKTGCDEDHVHTQRSQCDAGRTCESRKSSFRSTISGSKREIVVGRHGADQRDFSTTPRLHPVGRRHGERGRDGIVDKAKLQNGFSTLRLF